MNTINKEELAEMSGEKDFRRPVKYNVPIIRLNGQTGKFTRTTTNESGEWNTEELKGVKIIKGTMLKIRRSLRESKRDFMRFTNEHNSSRDKVIVFETDMTKEDDRRTSKIDEGMYDRIRPEYQDLKVHLHIYFLLDGEKDVTKLIVKGASLSSLFDYINELNSNEYTFESQIEIEPEAIDGNLGSYYAMKFKKGNKSDMDIVSEKIKEVNEQIRKQESYYAESNTDNNKSLETSSENEEDKPPVESYQDSADEQEQKQKTKEEIPTIEQE